MSIYNTPEPDDIGIIKERVLVPHSSPLQNKSIKLVDWQKYWWFLKIDQQITKWNANKIFAKHINIYENGKI